MNGYQPRSLLDDKAVSLLGRLEEHHHIVSDFSHAAEPDDLLDQTRTFLNLYLKQRKINDQALAELKEKVELHDGWIKQLAAKVGLRLTHE